jgi:hypothetical protein
MTIFWILFGIWVIWACSGILYFTSLLGQKYRKDKWYDSIFYIPLIPIIWFISFLKLYNL